MARILQVCNNDFYLMHFLAPLVRRLRECGHEVDCVCDGGNVDMAALGGNLPLYQLKFPLANSPGEFVRATRALRPILRRGRYDCVNSHNRSASIVARVAAWLENVPVNLYTAHGYYFHDDQGFFGREATIALEAALAQVTDYTLSQNGEDVRLMTSRGFVPEAMVEVIGNGIDTSRFNPRSASERVALERRLGLRPAKFRIVSTGRIVRAKGFGDALEAFASFHRAHPDAEFVIVGGNIARDLEPYQAQFFQRARELGVSSNVTVTGITTQVEEYLAVSDVFVLASYREGLPRAMLEAMSMTLPVVVSDIRGCREVVESGVNGYRFPPHDVHALATLLFRLYDDPNLRERLGKAARETVLRAFDERRYVDQQVRAINRLVGEPSSHRVVSNTVETSA